MTPSPDARTRLLAAMPRLRRFMFVLTGSLAAADDLLAEMCRHIGAGNCGQLPEQNADRWLFTLATMLGEQKQVETQAPIPVGIRSMGAVVARIRSDGASGSCELSEHQAVSKLTLEQRAILALVCIEGFSYLEAATILGVPVGTIIGSLIDARQVLAKEISCELGCARSVIANGGLDNSPIGQSDRRPALDGSSVSAPLPGVSEAGRFGWSQAQR